MEIGDMSDQEPSRVEYEDIEEQRGWSILDSSLKLSYHGESICPSSFEVKLNCTLCNLMVNLFFFLINHGFKMIIIIIIICNLCNTLITSNFT